MLPDLPLELWHRIIEHACTCDEDGDNRFNCSTPRVLSRTCRELRRVSRYYRYHEVTIRGWERLLAFEEEFFSTRGSSTEQEDDHSDGETVLHDYGEAGTELEPYGGVVHLNVRIRELWSVVYPNVCLDDRENGSETSDDSYAPSSDSSDGEEDGLGGVAGEGKEGEGDSEADGGNNGVDETEGEADLMEERALEFAEISDSEYREVADDKAALAEEGHVLSLFDSDTDGAQDLSYLLAGRPPPLARLEYRVYSSLRRVLEACAPTLEVLLLSWRPISTFFIEAVFPVLPALRVLRWDRMSGYYYYSFRIIPTRKAPVPIVFPVLQRLEMTTLSEADGLELMGPGANRVTIPHL
ncbi:hypothetical protein EST38_g12785 [Candolleomyces aberdarensis]|uniref:F-box domain-containing protein n=1 Tax=Candolleomyces aberdarensis TaxID=2316362 RepID=A0A4Q2D2B7_9AGAR|nr:hypothetical protein EST38_g12785 [Candolleomyces aberdarensis]